MSDTYFYDNMIGDFYSIVGDNFKQSFTRGQLFWAPIHYISENYKFWRPKNYDPSKTRVNEFEIKSSVQDDFNREIPIVSPKLGIKEEFLVVTAKKRPVILISPKPPKIKITKMRRGGKVNLNLCLVAPLYSLYDDNDNTKYDLSFISNIRKLEYLHLLYLPWYQTIIPKSSICKLDSVQTVHYNRMTAMNLRLSDAVLEVFQGMIKHHTLHEYDGELKVYRELILSESKT